MISHKSKLKRLQSTATLVFVCISFKLTNCSNVPTSEPIPVFEPISYLHFPSSFAILINMGHGPPRNIYSVKFHIQNCKKTGKVWDPFMEQCRQLHFNTSIDENNCESEQEEKIKFLNTQSDFVFVTMEFTVNLTGVQTWVTQHEQEIIGRFHEQFITRWNMTENQISNITVNCSTDSLININFLLLDKPSEKSDEILKMLKEQVINIKENYDILNQSIIASKFHSMLPVNDNFCTNETNRRFVYKGSEFTLLVREENRTYLHVNQTGRTYNPDEYVASILHVYNDIDNETLVSQNAVVCEQTLFNEHCPEILLQPSEFTFEESNLIYQKFTFEKYELTCNNSAFVCWNKHGHWHNIPLSVQIESILSTGLILVSIILLTLVLITFARKKSIRSTLNGFNMLNMVFCLETMQITFLTSQLFDKCHYFAIIFHYFILATISWSR